MGKWQFEVFGLTFVFGIDKSCCGARDLFGFYVSIGAREIVFHVQITIMGTEIWCAIWR